MKNKSVFFTLLLIAILGFSAFVLPQDNSYAFDAAQTGSADTIVYAGKKFIIIPNKQKGKFTFKIDQMQLVIIDNGQVSDFKVASLKAEAKINGVMVTMVSKDGNLEWVLEKFKRLTKHEVVYISEITGKSVDGKTINKILPGFKLKCIE